MAANPAISIFACFGSKHRLVQSTLVGIYCSCSVIRLLIISFVFLSEPGNSSCSVNKYIMTYKSHNYSFYKQEDYRKITVERKGETNFFTSQVSGKLLFGISLIL